MFFPPFFQRMTENRACNPEPPAPGAFGERQTVDGNTVDFYPTPEAAAAAAAEAAEEAAAVVEAAAAEELDALRAYGERRAAEAAVAAERWGPECSERVLALEAANAAAEAGRVLASEAAREIAGIRLQGEQRVVEAAVEAEVRGQDTAEMTSEKTWTEMVAAGVAAEEAAVREAVNAVEARHRMPRAVQPPRPSTWEQFNIGPQHNYATYRPSSGWHMPCYQ